ncbi:MAG: periplasmic heavy metal sensor, partial [Desulfovibrionaceae bacterium]
MRHLMIFLVAALLIAAFAPVSANARMHGQHMGGQRGWSNQDTYNPGSNQDANQNYQLSEEQQQAMQDIQQKYGDKLQQMSQDLWSKQAKLHAELASQDLNRDKVDQLVKEIGNIRARMFAN